MSFPTTPYLNQEYLNPFSGALYVFNGEFWQATIQATIKPDIILDNAPDLTLQQGNITNKPYIKTNGNYERLVLKTELENSNNDITFNGGDF